jgi:hypothetical protein
MSNKKKGAIGAFSFSSSLGWFFSHTHKQYKAITGPHGRFGSQAIEMIQYFENRPLKQFNFMGEQSKYPT